MTTEKGRLDYIDNLKFLRNTYYSIDYTERYKEMKDLNVKCRYCGRRRDEHLAQTLHCPLGHKHRILGFTSYHRSQTYEPKKKPNSLKN